MKKSISKREIETTVDWLLKRRQKDVRAVLRKFRKLSPQKQKQLDDKLLYLASILSIASKTKTKILSIVTGKPKRVRKKIVK
jgi:DNA-directed RNA polymerase subunit F